MQLRDKEGWAKLVYALVYPGLLGSMIFDIADPLRRLPEAGWGLVAIMAAYMIDYMHMVVDLDAENRKCWWQTLGDGAIAAFFCFGYFALTHVTAPVEDVPVTEYPYYCIWALGFLCIVYSIVFGYECIAIYRECRIWRISLRGFMRLLPLLFVAVGGCIIVLTVLFSGSGYDPVHGTVWVVCLSSGAYGVYVFGFGYREGSQVARVKLGEKPERDSTDQKDDNQWIEANEKFIYSEITRWIAQEHTLLSSRMGWLVSANAFLFAPVVLLLSNNAKSEIKVFLIGIICVLGMLVAFFLGVPMGLAVHTMHILRKRYTIFLRGVGSAKQYHFVDPEHTDTFVTWPTRLWGCHGISMACQLLIPFAIFLSWIWLFINVMGDSAISVLITPAN